MKKNDLSMLDRETREALEELLACFGNETYEWLAGLWEPEIGGFYYSNSGRDYEGFLPDIESTVQALKGLNSLGMFDAFDRDLKKALPEDMQKKLLAFATGLQDEEDGFFYHPQWGKNISFSRRARDNGWATQLIPALGGEYKYKLGNVRLREAAEQAAKNGEAAPKTTTPHLRSREAFLEYLGGFDLKTRSYYSGNMIASQHSQIRAAGLEDICLDFFRERQDPKTGAWEDRMCYNMTNGLMKISGYFLSAGAEFPNAEAAVETAIAGMFMEDKPKYVTDVYNPLVAASTVISTVRRAGKTELADKLDRRVLERSAELIRATMNKAQLFNKGQGSYSYELLTTSPTSQGAPVALKVAEGDVNATFIAINGTGIRFLNMLGVPNAGLYEHSDYEKFMKLLSEQKPPVKKPIPQ